MAAAHASVPRDLVVFTLLFVLTTATLLLSFVLHGQPGLIVAYVIALMKGLLVAWEYMHLKFEAHSSRFAMLAALLLAVLLVGLTAADVATRPTIDIRPPPLPEPGRVEH
jgi:caa(3)-type oxidase subunit IV